LKKIGNQNTDHPNKVIQGLWIGAELSLMEQLSIASFLENKHEYHLYLYDEAKNVPAGTIIKDASAILPPSMIFQYQGRPSYAGFANFFRYKLLLERGGWWADTDVVCLQPFDFPDEHVFATEVVNGSEVVASSVIKTPVGSRVMAYCWDVCKTKKPEELEWGETGPKLIGEAVGKISDRRPKSHQLFCPIGYDHWRIVLSESSGMELDQGTYAIHLWNEMWRLAAQDKNGEYPSGCLYEQLKRRYLPRREGRGQSFGNEAITSSMTSAPAGNDAAANAVRTGSGVTPRPGSQAE